ncbi:OpgC domain-containing protein [Salinisphaera sp. Q1T1-3]|uniref:OpgC domain-containing protein n=1 Tax=Salinisphaera sp. Q1T1-3 TaxID=2321229 RepID=UPI000E740E0A|nr:OpgC domain-containing protein [Salinisphaera sp. Q1T1-3]RJS94821.1 hypothetical protein D3260_03385 [Salinisphaera sp. Q1T1-3]
MGRKDTQDIAGDAADTTRSGSANTLNRVGSTPATATNTACAGRDHRVDSLRGLMLATMMIDHLGGPLEHLTFEPFGYASAAEGFVFLSGYMYALVYVRRASSSMMLVRQSLRRAGLIYRHHALALSLLVGLACFSPALIHYWSFEALIVHPLSWSTASMLLVNTPTFFDILPMYVVFVALTPALIPWLRYRAGPALVLGGSLALWGLGRTSDPVGALDSFFIAELRTPFFNLLSWQLVWVLGLLLGIYRDAIQQRVHRTPTWLFVGPALFIAVLCLTRHEVLGLSLSPAAVTRDDLGWLRILDFAGVLVIAAWLMTRVPVSARLPWFASLGQASIQVFTFHLFIVYFTLLVGWHIRAFGPVIYGAYTLVCLGSLTIPAYLWRWQRQRRRTRRSSPA